MEKKLKATVKVYSVEERDYLLYKYKGMFYPLPKIEGDEEGVDPLEVHTQPCALRASMVAQNQYAPFYDKKEIKYIRKVMKLEATFTF